MTNPRDILNEMKWRDKYDFEIVEIWYVHRGAVNDTKIIHGDKIIDLGKSFMNLGKSMIPYHRIFKIIYKGNTIFHRKK